MLLVVILLVGLIVAEAALIAWMVVDGRRQDREWEEFLRRWKGE